MSSDQRVEGKGSPFLNNCLVNRIANNKAVTGSIVTGLVMVLFAALLAAGVLGSGNMHFTAAALAGGSLIPFVLAACLLSEPRRPKGVTGYRPTNGGDVATTVGNDIRPDNEERRELEGQERPGPGSQSARAKRNMNGARIRVARAAEHQAKSLGQEKV